MCVPFQGVSRSANAPRFRLLRLRSTERFRTWSKSGACSAKNEIRMIGWAEHDPRSSGIFIGRFPPHPKACPLTPEKHGSPPACSAAPFAEQRAFPGMEQKRSMLRKKRGMDGRIGRNILHIFRRQYPFSGNGKGLAYTCTRNVSGPNDSIDKRQSLADKFRLEKHKII